ncbi:MAG: hypothetical protein IPF54_22585 [Draconibacterium sp.]|nr:hypothetical protein [Draconibacterium sp.]
MEPVYRSPSHAVTVRPAFSAGTISIQVKQFVQEQFRRLKSAVQQMPVAGTIQLPINGSTARTIHLEQELTTVANNTATYTPTQTLTQTTYYRRQAHDGTCNTSFTSSSNNWTVTVRPTFTAGTISNTGQTICSGTIPTTQIGSTTAASGGDNTITYQWQYSTDNTFATGVTTVANNTETYTPTQTLTQTTYYRRQAHDGTCNTSFTSSSNNWTVTVRPTFTAGTISNTGQTICSGTIPTTQIGSTTAASGGDNTITYQWQYSTDNTFATGVTTVASNTATYTPTQTLTQTTYYRRQAHDGTCNTSFSTSTNTWTVTVRPVFTAGTISNTGQTICSGTIPTTQIGSTTAASGGDNTITYQWQYSTDNTFATGVTTVGNNTATYTPTQTLTQTTYYRRQAHDGTCNTSFSTSTNTWTVTVRPVFTAGTISNTGQTICSGTVPTTQIGSTTNASGGDNTITYQWQYSTDNTFATGVTTVANNTATYTPTQTLTQTTYYRRQAHDGTCNTSFTSSSNIWTVTVNPLPIITIPPFDLTLCEGESGSFTVATSASSPTYQWGYATSPTPASWIDVPEGGDISGSETNVLSIANTLVGYSGVYVSCLITANGCETRSGAGLLIVNPLPVTGEIIPD